MHVTSGFPSSRTNLSPFTKDLRGGEQLNESIDQFFIARPWGGAHKTDISANQYLWRTFEDKNNWKQDAVWAYIWAWSYYGYDTLNMPYCSKYLTREDKSFTPLVCWTTQLIQYVPIHNKNSVISWQCLKIADIFNADKLEAKSQHST